MSNRPTGTKVEPAVKSRTDHTHGQDAPQGVGASAMPGASAQPPRSDADIYSGKSVPVALGGKEFALHPQPRKRSRHFKGVCSAALNELEGTITKLAGAFGSGDVVAVQEMIPMLSQFIGTHADGLLDLIYEYSPEFEANREWIENNATDEECCAALVSCVVMAFGPFVRLVTEVGKTTRPMTAMTGPTASFSSTENSASQ